MTALIGFMKVLLVILDGAAGTAGEGMTALQSARMPNLDMISKRSRKGMMYPIEKGVAPESDAAVFSILGYSLEDYTGRGPLEAFGAGLDVNGTTLALRCNFATIDKSRNIIDRRAGRIHGAECKELEKSINGIDLGIPKVSFVFRSTVGHRGVVVFNSDKAALPLSAQVSNADIGYTRKGNISVASESGSLLLPKVRALINTESAERTAEILNIFIDKSIAALSSADANRLRSEHGLLQANAILMRDAGVSLPKVKSLPELHGSSFAFIAEMPVEIGIAKLLGMEPIRLDPFAERQMRYEKMAELVLKNQDAYDFIYVHIKGPDEPGHDGDSELKRKVLEEIDLHFFSRISGISCRVCVTSDHATPCSMKAHSGDPVPLMVSGIGAPDASMKFDERIGGKGSLGIIKGRDLLPRLFS